MVADRLRWEETNATGATTVDKLQDYNVDQTFMVLHFEQVWGKHTYLLLLSSYLICPLE